MAGINEDYDNINLDELYKNSPEALPKNIAVAMDGNRRWSKDHGVSETDGHRVSIEKIKDVVKRAQELGVETINFWIFSTENFKRDKSFVEAIFSLAREYIKSGKYFDELDRMGGKLGFVGDLSNFPKDIAEGVKMYLGKSNPKEKKINVNFAFGYGGRDEILRAVKKVIKDKLKPEDITESLFYKYLDLKEDVDLMIRTGGHKRTSGLFIWQASYAEFYFMDTLCPDFGVSEFEKAVRYFVTCTRNFGR